MGVCTVCLNNLKNSLGTKKTPITWAYQVRTGFANRAVALGPMDFFDELSKGPVMLLITRRYFPSSYSPFYAQVKEVALDYFNCNKSGNVTRLKTTTHQINSGKYHFIESCNVGTEIFGMTPFRVDDLVEFHFKNMCSPSWSTH